MTETRNAPQPYHSNTSKELFRQQMLLTQELCLKPLQNTFSNIIGQIANKPYRVNTLKEENSKQAAKRTKES